MESWKNKRVLITGACGTIGGELIRQLLLREPQEIIGLDNNENDVFFLSEAYRDHKNIHIILCDIRNGVHLRKYFSGIDVVIHTAARKHVILCEKAPDEAVDTNIIGTQNIINAASEFGVERVLFTSSDKAVNPTNVMGTSKLMGERLMTAANASKRGDFPIFISTRFGNVLGSKGSVIPVFKRQIDSGGPLTITDARMTRFVMTIPEAANLVLDSMFIGKGGEVFVTKMPSIKIEDLAHAMISHYVDRHPKGSVEIKLIGAKPGEKLYEELINEEEIRRTIELDKYFVVLPAFRSLFSNIDYQYTKNQNPIDKVYRSDIEEVLGQDTLKEYLLKHKLI